MLLALALACHVDSPRGSAPHDREPPIPGAMPPQPDSGAPSTASWTRLHRPSLPVLVGDVDGDGAADLAAATDTEVQVVVGPVAGGGDWSSEHQVASDPALSYDGGGLLGAGDVDGDGRDDLWIEDGSGVAWLLVGGPGAWRAAASTAAGEPWLFLSFANLALQTTDIDGDGSADLLEDGADGLGVYLGPLLGPLLPVATVTRSEGRFGPALDARPGDFDGDGAADVAAWAPFEADDKYYDGSADGDVYLFSALRSGTVDLQDADLRIYASATEISAVDWNGDGWPDLALVGDFVGDPGVYWGGEPVLRIVEGPFEQDFDATVAPDLTVLFDGTPNAFGVGSPGDVTGDGAEDLSFSLWDAMLLLPGGAEGEAYASDLALDLGVEGGRAAVGRDDLDGDGAPDLAVYVDDGTLDLWTGGL